MTLLESTKLNPPIDEWEHHSRNEKIVLPKTRYYGSKRRHAPWLLQEFRQLGRGKVLDLFGGTATTSLIFKHLGNHIYFYDCFLFNRICAQALLNGPHEKFDKSAFSNYLNKIVSTDGFISTCFHDLYFTDQENRWLDGISKSICRLRDHKKRNIIYYCLFQACLAKRPFNLFHRANLYIRHNHSSSSFGNKTTWEKSFESLMLSAYLELEKAWKIRNGSAQVLCESGLKSITPEFEIIYIDPPYIKKDRSHESYATRYHFLEGLANYKDWPNWIDEKSLIKKLTPEAQPPEWKTEADFISGIYDVLEKYRSKHMVISYAERSRPELGKIVSMLSDRNAEVHVHKRAYKCSLASSERDEYLIIAELKP